MNNTIKRNHWSYYDTSFFNELKQMLESFKYRFIDYKDNKLCYSELPNCNYGIKLLNKHDGDML